MQVLIGGVDRDYEVWDSTMKQWLASLISVAISYHGSVALVSAKVICYFNLKSAVPILNAILTANLTYYSDTSSSETILSTGNQTFTDARFNDDGSVLYAWSFGRPDDRLHIWLIYEATRELIQPTDSQGSYASVRPKFFIRDK